MLEVEMKFPVADFAALEARLQTWQAKPEPPIDEADHYFNAPDRDFAQTDEAFRLRRIGTRNMLTYKGPKAPGPAKTRTEIEVSLQEGPAAAEDMIRLIEKLGYRPTAVVHKRRRIFHLERQGFALQVCLDEVTDVGTFAEVEIVAPPENRAQAEKVLLEVAADLGLEGSERRSYLEMFLESRSKDPRQNKLPKP